MCRTFALPEIKQGDFAVGGQKNSFSFRNSPKTDNASGGTDDDEEGWMDDELLAFLDQLPEDFQMNDDLAMNIPSTEETMSEVAVSEVSAVPSTAAPTVFDFNGTFANLPSAKTFSHLSFKTPEMVRNKKLHSLDAFIGALNDGDVFGLHSIATSQCEPDVQFHSRDFGFNYSGCTSLFMFWALIFEKHYEGRVSLLQSRLNSTIKPNFAFAADSGVFESVDFVIKLEASRLTKFQSFDFFRALMESGLVQAGLSLPELMALTAAFAKNYQLQRQQQEQQQEQQTIGTVRHNHHLYRVVYLFEFNLRFHAIKHTITHWSMNLIAIEQH